MLPRNISTSLSQNRLLEALGYAQDGAAARSGVAVLCNVGLLSLQGGGADNYSASTNSHDVVYKFSLPGVGSFAKQLSVGHRELLATIRRRRFVNGARVGRAPRCSVRPAEPSRPTLLRRYHEITRRELLSRARLRTCTLRPSYVLSDALGRGAVEEVFTGAAQATIVRLMRG